jgi:hypothetical protein
MRDESPTYDFQTMGNDEYRIPGVSEARLRTALTLLSATDRLRGESADARRDLLVRAMIVADVDPVPAATIGQARRLAEHRGKLLVSGAYTMAALTELRGATSESSTRTWLTRRRHAHELFSVTHDGVTLVPAFQFDEAGEPVAGLPPVLTALDDAGLEGWAVWTWFHATSGWLSGKRPADLIGVEPERVAAAARRMASNAA